MDEEISIESIELAAITEGYSHEAYELQGLFNELDQSVSTEDFRSVLKRILDAIKGLWERIRKVMSESINTTRLTASARLQEVKFLKEKTKRGLSFTASTESMKFKSRIPTLTLSYRPVNNMSAWNSQASNYTDILKKYYNWHEKSLIPFIKDAARIVSSLSFDNAQTVENSQLLPRLSTGSPIALKRILGMKPFESEGDAYASDPLLGNRRIFVKGNVDPKSVPDYSRVTSTLYHTATDPKPLPSEVSLLHFGMPISDQCLDNVKELLEEIVDGNSKEKVKNVHNAVDDLIKQLDKAATRLGDENDSESLSPNERAVKEITQTLRQAIVWTANPFDGLGSLGLQIAATGIMVCKRNVNQKGSEE